MVTKADYDTANIVENAHCVDCGWPVIHIVANWDHDIAIQINPEMESIDFWAYCSNKTCKNHDGENWYTSDPSFLERE